jgi:hypothetical protein
MQHHPSVSTTPVSKNSYHKKEIFAPPLYYNAGSQPAPSKGTGVPPACFMVREGSTGDFEVNIGQLIAILIILGAYGLTWYFLIKSMRIVNIIDREGLKHSSEIKARFKHKSSRGESDEQSGQGERGNQKKR